jgi:hypothetical protein
VRSIFQVFTCFRPPVTFAFVLTEGACPAAAIGISDVTAIAIVSTFAESGHW